VYKIIFLDDELITLRMLKTVIDWQNYRITVCGTASDGDEGINLFQQVEPDIVIADIRMPKMNGIEFARAIRQTPKRVKIILLSAYAEFEYAQSAIGYQISDYLLKPLDENKLEVAIARIVQELDRDNTVSSTVENYRMEQAEKQLQQLFVRDHEGSNLPDITLSNSIRETFGQSDTFIHALRVTEPHELQTNTDVEGIKLFFKDHLGPHTAAVRISPVELIVLTSSLDLPEPLDDLVSVLCYRAQPVRAGISAIPEPFDLTKAYKQAEDAL